MVPANLFSLRSGAFLQGPLLFLCPSPDIIRKFNSSVKGFSTGTYIPLLTKRVKYNVAVSGARTGYVTSTATVSPFLKDRVSIAHVTSTIIQSHLFQYRLSTCIEIPIAHLE